MHIHHSIDYIEFTVCDLVAAKRFYGAAFGWTFTDYGPDYAGIHGKDREPGGRRFQFEDPSGNELAVWSER